MYLSGRRVELLNVPVSLFAHWFSLGSLYDQLHGILPGPKVCGGITEFRRISAVADAYGVTMSPHWFHDLHVQLVAATPNAHFVEHFPDDEVLNFRRLIDRQLEVHKGRLRLPSLPGLGFGFDEEIVAELSHDGWR